MGVGMRGITKMEAAQQDAIYAPHTEEMANYYGLVVQFLDSQPTSFERVFDVEDLIERVVSGRLLPWFYMHKGEIIGMALISVHEYSDKYKSLRIELLTCKHFFKMTSMIDVLENRAAAAGFHTIEALTHPAIAKYATRKKGFVSPMVYIEKTLTPVRMN